MIYPSIIFDEIRAWDDDESSLLAAGTPYENGIFRMKLLLSHDFPQSPPKGTLLLAPFVETNAPSHRQ